MPYKFKKDQFFTPKGFPVVVFRDVHRKRIPPHTHEFVELVIITGGMGLHVMEQTSWPVGAGNVFVIGRGMLHGYRNTEDLTLINILYDPERLAMPLRDLRTLAGYHTLFTLEPSWRKRRALDYGLRLTGKDLVSVEGLVKSLEDELQAHRPGYKFMALTLLMQIVGFLARCYNQAVTPNTMALMRLGQAISYMETHYERRLSMTEIAVIAHMSKRHFQRLFQDALHISPLYYLIRLRIMKATDIISKHLSIKEAMYQVGFQNSSYFCRQFRHIIGFTPREFRKMAMPCIAPE